MILCFKITMQRIILISYYEVWKCCSVAQNEAESVQPTKRNYEYVEDSIFTILVLIS